MPQVACANCGKRLVGRQKVACGSICRGALTRKRQRAERNGTVVQLHQDNSPGKSTGSRRPRGSAAPSPVADPPRTLGAVESATLAELTVVGNQDSADGLTLIALARRIDCSDGESGSGLGRLVAEWRSLKEAATRTDTDAGDQVDDIRRHRAAHGGR